MDKNGNFRFTLNIYTQIVIDKSGARDLVNVREVFVSLTYKGKFVVKNQGKSDQYLNVVSKSAEVSNIKILKSDGEEMVVEQMMITSSSSKF